MCNQTRGFSYTVEYSTLSSNSSSFHPELCRPFESIEEAKFHGLQEVARLAANGTTIRDLIVEEFCLNCNGNGVIYKNYKRIKYRKKEVKCPVCKGKNSLVKIFQFSYQ